MQKRFFSLIIFITLIQGICFGQDNINNQNFAFRLFKSYNKFIIKNNKNKTENFFITPYRIGQDFAFLGLGSKGNTQKSLYKAIAPILTIEEAQEHYLHNKHSKNNNKSIFLLDNLDSLEKYQGEYSFTSLSLKEFNKNSSNYEFIDKQKMHSPLSIISQSSYNLSINTLSAKYYNNNDWEVFYPQCSNKLCTIIINFPEEQENNNLLPFFKLRIFDRTPQNNYFAFIKKLNKKFFQEELIKQKENAESINSFSLPAVNLLTEERLSQTLSNSGLSLIFSSPADFSDFNCHDHLKLSEFYHKNKLAIQSEQPSKSHIITDKTPYIIIIFAQDTQDIMGIYSHLPLEK